MKHNFEMSKRYTEDEIKKIVSMRKTGKEFEAIQASIEKDLNIHRPVRALRIIFERHKGQKIKN